MFLDDITTERALRRRASHRMGLVMAALLACILMVAGLTFDARAETGAPAIAATKAAAEPEGYVRPNDMGTGALLFPSRETGYFVEAPRLSTDVAIDVNGPVIRTRVTQRFLNPSKGWVEGTYVFPLPEDSAVDTLKMQIGERFIAGEIKPREEARQVYEQAKAEGKKAALLEQQRPNIFTNQVANIGPGETIVVQIEYQSSTKQSDGLYRCVSRWSWHRATIRRRSSRPSMSTRPPAMPSPIRFRTAPRSRHPCSTRRPMRRSIRSR